MLSPTQFSFNARLTPAWVAMLYAGFAALWIVASDHLLALVSDDQEMLLRIGTIKGFAFVAITTLLLYLLLSSWRERAVPVPESDLTLAEAKPQRRRLNLAFVGMALLLPLIAYGIVRLHGPQVEHEAFDNLHAIARLKTEQIENWLTERQHDSDLLAGNAGFAQHVQEAFVSGDATALVDVKGMLESLHKVYDYDTVELFAADDQSLLVAGSSIQKSDTLLKMLAQARRSGRVMHGDLIRDDAGIHIDWVVPLRTTVGRGGAVPVVVLRKNPEKFLFPLIRSWPTASDSGESLLVRREGDSLLFLNAPRHRDIAAMTLRRPIPAEVDLAAAEGGQANVRDYRKVEVMTAYRPVAGTDWYLVTKMDREEVMAHLRDLVFWVSLLGMVAVAMLSALLLVLWRQQLRSHRLQLAGRVAAVQHAGEQRFRSVANASSDAIIVGDGEGLIVSWNAGAEKIFGYTRGETIGEPLTMIMPEHLRAAHLEGMRRVMAGGARHAIGCVAELEGRHKDGRSFPIELALSEWEEGGECFFAGTIRDITKRKQAAQALELQKSLYAMLSETNQAIVRIHSHELLFPEVCRIAVAHGFFRAASIGLIGKSDHRVHTVARFGEEAAAIEHIDVSIEEADAHGRGPAGQALRSGKSVICNDFLNDLATEPWHEIARKCSVRSAAAFPLRMNGVVIGPLNLYAATPGFFSDDVVATLTEMSNDISFALDNYARDAHLKQALASAKVMAQVVDASPTIIFRWKAEANWPVVYVSDNVSRWGYSAAMLMVGKPAFPSIVHPDDLHRVADEVKAHVSAGRDEFTQEYRIVTASGDVLWMDDRTTVRRNAAGEVLSYEGVLSDISAHKAAQVALQTSEGVRRAVLDSLSAHVAVLDRSGTIVAVNAAWARFAAKNDAPVLLAHPEGQNYLILCDRVAGADQASAHDAAEGIRAVLNGTRETFWMEYACHSADSQRWYDMHVSPLEAAGGGAVVSHTNITDRMRAGQVVRDAEAQFRSLVEQSIAGILIIQDGVLSYVNPRFAEILGYDAPEVLIGRDPLSLIAESDRQRIAEHMAQIVSGQVTHLSDEFGALACNGTVVMLGVSGSIANYRGKPAIIGMMQDIREKKAAENEIKRYVDQLENAFMHTVGVATTLSELRDPYTAGHERRVAEVAVAIGAELGLDERQQQGLRVAGHLHDIGKIGVPTEILAKPGKLSSAEFALIKVHAQAGYDVLKGVEFPWPVADITLQHHERMDGSGYPNGLRGDEILFDARIMAVADTVEAMSSHRPYRPGLGIDKALAEIERGRGTIFDAKVADACLRLFREKAYTIPA